MKSWKDIEKEWIRIHPRNKREAEIDLLYLESEFKSAMESIVPEKPKMNKISVYAKSSRELYEMAYLFCLSDIKENISKFFKEVI